MKTKKCIECSYLSEDCMCTCEKGVFHNGVELSKEILTTPINCSEYKESTYVLTPKGILYASLKDNDVHIDYDTFENVWTDFEKTMKKMNYVHDEE